MTTGEQNRITRPCFTVSWVLFVFLSCMWFNRPAEGHMDFFLFFAAICIIISPVYCFFKSEKQRGSTIIMIMTLHLPVRQSCCSYLSLRVRNLWDTHLVFHLTESKILQEVHSRETIRHDCSVCKCSPWSVIHGLLAKECSFPTESILHIFMLD